MKSYDARMIHGRYRKKRYISFVVDVVLSEIIAYVGYIASIRLSCNDSSGMLEIIQSGNVLLPFVLLLIVYMFSDLICGGHSIGKRMFGLKIVDLSNGQTPKAHVLILRNLPICLWPLELVYQILVGESLGDKATGTIVLPTDEIIKDRIIPEWMEVVDKLPITKLKRVGAVAFVFLLFVTVSVSLFQATKTKEYSVARDYLIVAETTSEQEPLVILTSYSLSTVTYEDYKERTAEFQFIVDGKLKIVTCTETETGWEVIESNENT